MFVLSTLAIALQIWTICALWLFSPSQGVTFSLFNFYFSSTWALWVAITVNGTYYEKVYFTCKSGMAENGLPSARAMYTVQRWGLIEAALFLCIWNFHTTTVSGQIICVLLVDHSVGAWSAPTTSLEPDFEKNAVWFMGERGSAVIRVSLGSNKSHWPDLLSIYHMYSKQYGICIVNILGHKIQIIACTKNWVHARI